MRFDSRVVSGGCLAAILLVYGSWQVFRFGPADGRVLIGDAFFYPVGLAATWTAWRASRRCRPWARLRRAWLLLAGAALAYLLGDVAQTVYEAAGRRPYPSVADLLYLAFYPLMLAGLLSFPRARRGHGESMRLAIDLAVVALGGSGLVVYVVLGPTAETIGTNALQSACSIAYPVGDMILLVGFASLLLRGSARSSRPALRLLALGLGFYVVADLIYGYVTLHGSYQGGDSLDAFWMVAIALFAAAATLQRPVDGPEPIDAGRTRASWLPYVAVVIGFGVLLYSDRHDPAFPGLTMTLIAMALVGLVSLRQFVGQRDLINAQGQLVHQALHDTLTGLPNRLLVLDRTEQALRRAERTDGSVSVLFVDLDHFKQINDTFGHGGGDELLAIVSARLSSAVRAADTVGRLGGDEFVVVLDPDGPFVPADLVAERILSVLRQPVELTTAGGRSLTISASVGVVTGTRESADELLRDADTALYQAKGAGRNRFVLFEGAMHAAVEDRLWLEMDLVDAVEENQFFLEYQPTFGIESGEVTGVEALVRWRHPVRGVIAPNRFVPLAEETGLIVPLGRWVLREACRQTADWRRRGSPMRVAVNVSGRQLDDPAFVDDVSDALKQSGLDPCALTLEITETALMQDAVGASERLELLKRLGLRIAIDDFGTGYSSLAYLRQFPLDLLKIDRSFVSEIETSEHAAALVHTLVQLGRSLELEVLGEGIETEGQLVRLHREGCDLGQGFLLARPLRPAAVEELLGLDVGAPQAVD